MARSKKSSITRDSVFRRTETDVTAQAVEEEVLTRQTAVWLSDDEINWLDNQCQQIKQSGWRGVTRSALIRALVQAAMQSEPTLNGVNTEEEITQRLTS